MLNSLLREAQADVRQVGYIQAKTQARLEALCFDVVKLEERLRKELLGVE